jgi:Ser/Thr protein kinase RdoA (MazF antagonist)
VTTPTDGTSGTSVYEVHTLALGRDRYRDVPSWSPYAEPSHAEAAGRALAAFHRAAARFTAPARAPGPLVVSTAVVASTDPRAALERLMDTRPTLVSAVDRTTVRRDFDRWHRAAVERVAPLLAAAGDQWGHGDWHPSNLTWSPPGRPPRVVAVLDLGLANRTSAVHDLAVAIERAGVDWLGVGPARRVRADLAGVAALLRGYGAERALTDVERAALPDAVRVAHLEYALSEVEYFAGAARSPAEAAAAYTDYFVGHARWFAAPAGAELLDAVRRAVTA